MRPVAHDKRIIVLLFDLKKVYYDSFSRADKIRIGAQKLLNLGKVGTQNCVLPLAVKRDEMRLTVGVENIPQHGVRAVRQLYRSLKFNFARLSRSIMAFTCSAPNGLCK